MKTWNVIINFLGNTVEVKVQAKSYSEAYARVEETYAGCIIKKIYEIRSKSKRK